jgi:hypothetical protein
VAAGGDQRDRTPAGGAGPTPPRPALGPRPGPVGGGGRRGRNGLGRAAGRVPGAHEVAPLARRA